MNSQLQIEEVEALRAIYDDSFTTQSDGTHRVCLCSDDTSLSLELVLIFPDDYPGSSPPVYELRYGPLFSSADLTDINNHLQQMYKDSGGEVVVYQWVEWLREWLSERAQSIVSVPKSSPVEDTAAAQEREELSIKKSPQTTTQSVSCPDIVHGEPLTDRRSTFQAHLARVKTVEEVKKIISVLKENKKIASATHNIMAYRIHRKERDVYLQDCDDDGEAAAGGRLLHLLQIMDARDVCVVVTRWFGGILLHADRFKHINNVARTVIQNTGLGLEHNSSTVTSTKEKKHLSKSKGGKNR